MKPKTILFLYTRLADYFYQCILQFSVDHPEFDVVIVRYREDVNAPYQFREQKGVRLVYKDSLSNLEEFTRDLNVATVYCAGWSDKDYVAVAKRYFDRVPTVVGIDNPWEGSLRQHLGILYYKLFLKSVFSHVWVPGAPQYEFARKLGYQHFEILKGLYVANVKSINVAARPVLEAAKTLLFIGRLVPYKQALLLATLFSDIVSEKKNNNWRLLFVGNGEDKQQIERIGSTAIEVRDFIQPPDLPMLLSTVDAFCLPSKSEHWGVTVHEAVASGLPLLLSDSTYAGTTFLKDKINGFRFKDSCQEELKEAMYHLFESTTQDLESMRNWSLTLANKVSYKDWEMSLLQLIKQDNEGKA